MFLQNSFFLSELVVNRILIVSIVINKILCSISSVRLYKGCGRNTVAVFTLELNAITSNNKHYPSIKYGRWKQNYQ